LIGESGGVVGQTGELKAGDLGGQRDHSSDFVVGEVQGGSINIEDSDESFPAEIVALFASGFGKGEEAGDVKLAVIGGDGEAARLEMAGAVRIIGDGFSQVDLPQNGLGGGIDNRNRVLAAISDKNALAVGGTNDIPGLSAGGQSGQDVGAEGSPGRIIDLDDSD